MNWHIPAVIANLIPPFEKSKGGFRKPVQRSKANLPPLEEPGTQSPDGELERHLAMERLVSSLSKRFITEEGLDTDQQIKTGLMSIAEFVGCDESCLIYFDNSFSRVERLFEWRRPGLGQNLDAYLDALVGSNNRFLKQVQAGQVGEISDLHQLTEMPRTDAQNSERHEIRSLLGIPIQQANRILCVLSLGHSQPEKHWLPADIQLLGLTGEILARAVEHLDARYQLQKSEREKALVLDAVEESIVHVDKDLKVRSLNRAASASAGAASATLMGRYCYEVWHGRQSPCADCPVEKAVQTGVPQEGEMRSDNGRTWNVKGYPVRNDLGEVIGGVYVTLEITHRKQTEQKLQHKITQQAQLIDATRHLTESMDVKTVLTRIVSGARQIIDAYGCTLYLLEKEQNILRPVVAIDPPYEEEILATPLDVDQSFTGQAVKQRKSLIFNDPISQEIGQHIPETPEDDNERLIVAPLIVDEQVQGAMCLNRMGQIFTEEDLRLAEAFAAFASTVLKNAQTYDSLQYEINERRSTEQALAESEQHLRMVMDQAPVGIVTIDMNGVVTDINQAGLEILGAPSRAATVGLNVFQLPTLLDSGLDRHFHEVLDSGQAREMETWYTSLWGKRTYLRSNLVPRFNGFGEQVGALQLLEDTTDRKQADEQLHLQGKTMEAAANGILITDRDGKVVWANPAVEALTGYTPQEMIGQNLQVFRSGMQDETNSRNLWQTILNGRVWKGEMISRRKDGSLYYEEMTITPVYDEYNGISHFINIRQDITAEKERVIQQNAILQMSEALRGLATSHEMAPVITQQVVQLLGAEGAALDLRIPTNGHSEMTSSAGNWSGDTDIARTLNETLCREIYDCKQARFLSWLETSVEVSGASDFLAGVPLIAQDEVIGVLCVGRGADYCENEVSILVSLADLIANALQRATLHEDTQRRVQQLAALHNIDLAINASLDINVTLTVLLSQLQTQLNVDAADILRLDHQTQTLQFLAGRGFCSKALEKVVIPMGIGAVSQAALERKRIVIPDMSVASFKSVRNFQMMGENFIFYCVEPLIAKGRVIAVLEVFQRKTFEADAEWLDFLETLAGQAAIAIDNATLFYDLQRSNQELAVAYNTTLEGWARALELRDEATEGHTRRVTDLTVRLARAMGIPDVDLVHVQRGAMLHDIGKIAVPDRILTKPGPLTEDEWEIMRMHPVYAREMLSTIPYLEKAIEIPFYHHERWDGTGYPLGLMGQEIPLAARIFAVVDIWDALRNERVYREAWPDEAVLAYIKEQAGSHLDPEVARVFLELIEDLT